MRRLGSQKPIRAAQFGEVPQGLSAHFQPRLLEGAFEQTGVELADDVWNEGARLPKDAVPGDDLVTIPNDVVGTEGSQLS